MRTVLRVLNFIVFSPFLFIMLMIRVWRTIDDKLEEAKK